ncbi:hypothetical protein BJV78DRAFT_1365409, partial [Lactifluus subvellereus]
ASLTAHVFYSSHSHEVGSELYAIICVLPPKNEVDPDKKLEELLEVSPKGLVPGLKLHTLAPPRGLNESTVILEYLDQR